MKYYIADNHFAHANIIEFCNRPFNSVEEMDQFMINAWNRVVTQEDEVYIIGDLIYRSKKPYTWYLEQLPGKKHLIIGNHDGLMIKQPKAAAYFESIEKTALIRDNGKKIFLCHYPVLEWPGYFRGEWCISGHIHNAKNEAYYILKNMEKQLNAGVDIINFAPCTFEELVKYNEIYKKED